MRKRTAATCWWRAWDWVLIVYALRANPKVKMIVVVERDADVIRMVKPLVPECRIVHADWNQYESPFTPDGVYYDLFVGNGLELLGDAIREMMKLRRRWPDAECRIFGFENSILQQSATAMIAAQRKFQRGMRRAKLTGDENASGGYNEPGARTRKSTNQRIKQRSKSRTRAATMKQK